MKLPINIDELKNKAWINVLEFFLFNEDKLIPRENPSKHL